MDGVESNDGLFVVASTNYLEKLDPGLTKRPSRFDRKYLFPMPNEHERVLYCEYWHRKLKPNKNVDFPKKLCQPMAHVTPGFSFAFLQECFVATMLELAREDHKTGVPRAYDAENEDLDDYPLWVAFKQQAKILRREIDSQKVKSSQLKDWCRSNAAEADNGAGDSHGSAKSSQHHCRCCRERRGESAASGVRDMPVRLQTKEEVLPELPWYDQKDSYINSACWEMRL